jgi:hypothetical protein
MIEQAKETIPDWFFNADDKQYLNSLATVLNDMKAP